MRVRNDEDALGFVTTFTEDAMTSLVTIFQERGVPLDLEVFKVLTQLAAVTCLARYPQDREFITGMVAWSDVLPAKAAPELNEWVMSTAEVIYTEEVGDEER